MGRADAFVNFTYVVSLFAPIGTYVAVGLARRGRHEAHRNAQLGLLALCWAAVLVLETRIRLEGGSGAFIAQAAPELQVWARRLLNVHIAGAVATYLLWSALAVVSFRRFRTRLPGDFSRTHGRLGRTVFWGLCFTAASASGMYVLAFVL